MGDECIFAAALHRGQAQEAGVVTQAACGLCFGQRLCGAAGQARSHEQRPAAAQGQPVAGGVHGQFQHRCVQAAFADGELRGMHAHGQAAGPGVQVVAGQGALAARIELAFFIQRQQVGWHHRAAAQHGQHVGRDLCAVHLQYFPSRAS